MVTYSPLLAQFLNEGAEPLSLASQQLILQAMAPWPVRVWAQDEEAALLWGTSGGGVPEDRACIRTAWVAPAMLSDRDSCSSGSTQLLWGVGGTLRNAHTADAVSTRALPCVIASRPSVTFLT